MQTCFHYSRRPSVQGFKAITRTVCKYEDISLKPFFVSLLITNYDITLVVIDSPFYSYKHGLVNFFFFFNIIWYIIPSVLLLPQTLLLLATLPKVTGLLRRGSLTLCVPTMWWGGIIQGFYDSVAQYIAKRGARTPLGSSADLLRATATPVIVISCYRYCKYHTCDRCLFLHSCIRWKKW